MIAAILLAAGLNTSAISHRPRAAVSAAAQTSASLVYVADQANNAIYVYNNMPNATPIRVITSGLNVPTGLNVDSSGNLYVANYGGNDVLVYAPGSVTPSRTYSQGLYGPIDVKVSLAGEVYVSNFNGGNIVVYAPGSTNPLMTWQPPIANALPLGIALQSPDYAPGGDVYVSYVGPSGGGLLWCPTGSPTCFDTGISLLGFSLSLAFQYNTFPLTLVASDQGAGLLDVFHLRHGKLPAAQIPVAGFPNGAAFDRTFTHLFAAYVPSSARVTNLTNMVNEYNYPSGTIAQTFLPPKSVKPSFLSGVAVYPSATY